MSSSRHRRGERGGPSFRFEHFQQRIADELAILFRDDIEDPALTGVRILAIALSADGRSLRVDVAVPHPERARAALARAAGFLRSRVGEAIDQGRVPELRFVVHPEVAS